MRRISVFVLIIFCLPISAQQSDIIGIKANPSTYCNPVNLNYYMEQPATRSAADPVIIPFKGNYILFATSTPGYWYSPDMRSWNYVPKSKEELPLGTAPAAFQDGEYVYYMASAGPGQSVIHRTNDPVNGKWELVSKLNSKKLRDELMPTAIIDAKLSGSFGLAGGASANLPKVWDPGFLLDDDGKLYLYYGISDFKPIAAIEINRRTWEFMGEGSATANQDNKKNGFERPGDFNQYSRPAFVEGAWMTKHNGTYYLQYAVGGTEFNSYTDGVWTSKNPLGPFTPAPWAPAGLKTTGFVNGAGHSCTFKAFDGSYWRANTALVGINQALERRIVIYPAGFDKDGVLHTNTYLGDFPQYIPGQAKDASSDNLPGWMPLSYKKPVAVSSTLDGFPASNAVDENVKTFWASTYEDYEPTMSIDLQEECTIYAIQLNFAEIQMSSGGGFLGLTAGGDAGNPNAYKYQISASNDGLKWTVIVDKKDNKKDLPHDYMELNKPVKARYVKVQCFWPGKWPEGLIGRKVSSIRDFRIFGFGSGEKPPEVGNVTAVRNPKDDCVAKFYWDSDPTATGYVIRYGIAPDKLYFSYTLYADKGNEYTIGSFIAGQQYYYAIDAFNENGITKGKNVYQLGPTNNSTKIE
jgi:xylan 1,4-beta-xylosidase